MHRSGVLKMSSCMTNMCVMTDRYSLLTACLRVCLVLELVFRSNAASSLSIT